MTKDSSHPKSTMFVQCALKIVTHEKNAQPLSQICKTRRTTPHHHHLKCRSRKAAEKVKRNQMNANKFNQTNQVLKIPLQEIPTKTSQQRQIKTTAIITYALTEERTNPGSCHNPLTHLLNHSNVPDEVVNHKIDNVLPMVATTRNSLLDYPVKTSTLGEPRLTLDFPDPNHTNHSPQRSHSRQHTQKGLLCSQGVNRTNHTHPHGSSPMETQKNNQPSSNLNTSVDE